MVTRVQDENGKWYYFRFWEGAALNFYLEAIERDLAKVLRIYVPHVNVVITTLPQSNKCMRFMSMAMLEREARISYTWDNKDVAIMQKFANLKLIEKLMVSIRKRFTGVDQYCDVPLFSERCFNFIWQQSNGAPVHLNNCVKLASIMLSLQDYEGKMTQGMPLSNRLIPISQRVALTAIFVSRILDELSAKG